MDYRKLLLKYIKHVEECEGIDFLDTTSNISFTEQELKELELLSEIDYYACSSCENNPCTCD
jgi:hypothetical protein